MQSQPPYNRLKQIEKDCILKHWSKPKKADIVQWLERCPSKSDMRVRFSLSAPEYFGISFNGKTQGFDPCYVSSILTIPAK